MFGAMMDGIKEESVGFLFNLEVQVEEQPPADAVAIDGAPQLDESLLEAAEAAHGRVAPPPDRVEPDPEPEAKTPHVSARGLDRDASSRPLVYTAPTLGSDTPEVRVTAGDESSDDSKTTRRQQQSRSNPNRGSRGNRRRRK